MSQIESRLEQDGAAWRESLDIARIDITVPTLDSSYRQRRPAAALRRWAVPSAVGLVAGVVIVASVLTLDGSLGSASHVAPAASDSYSATPPAVNTSASPDPLSPTIAHAVMRNLPRLTTAPLLSAAQARGLISMPWLLADQPAGKSLTIFYAAGDSVCVAPEGVHITETPTTVEIDVLSKNFARGDVACADDLELGRSVITLAAPLGHRELLHGPVDHAWATALDSDR